ncbi:hypothetical protein [Agrobacterium fabrum]|uniref:hypothetical protein n=1 Tax=Agrobacterium fabrum TaxID=1176649 RepID=UPI003BA24175
MIYLTNPIAVAHATPKTRDDIAIRDAVRARLAVVENAIVDFVSEKTAEGLSLDELDALYAVELPIFSDIGMRTAGSGHRTMGRLSSVRPDTNVVASR